MAGAGEIKTLLRRVLFPPRRNLVFAHLPKCGGTSLHSAISRVYPRRRVTRLLSRSSRLAADQAGRSLLAYRRDLLIYELQRGGRGRFLSGHWALDAGVCRAYRPAWSFVTLLRDPVERWLSHYFHNAAADGPFRIDETLEVFLSTPRARLLGSVYVRQLNGGAIGDEERIGAEAIEAARRTLDAFDLVGTVERLEQFRAGFQRLFGASLIIGRERSGDPLRRGAVTPGQRQRIAELCAGDLLVYEHAASRRTDPG